MQCHRQHLSHFSVCHRLIKVHQMSHAATCLTAAIFLKLSVKPTVSERRMMAGADSLLAGYPRPSERRIMSTLRSLGRAGRSTCFVCVCSLWWLSEQVISEKSLQLRTISKQWTNLSTRDAWYRQYIVLYKKKGHCITADNPY